MRAVQYSEFGDSSVLALQQVDEPHAGPGQVRIAVRAAEVNPLDWKIRLGWMNSQFPTALPKIPGGDASGVVDQVGDGVTGVSVGDAVFGAGDSVTAEFAVLTHFVLKPEAVSFEEAAGYGGVVETAGRGLSLLGALGGKTLVVNGAAGGVGTAVVQLAVQAGATVIGTAGARNQDYVQSLGATATTYGEGMLERIKALAPQAVDYAFDTAGRGTAAGLATLTPTPQNVVTIADFEAGALGVQVTTGGGVRSWQTLGEVAKLAAAGQFSLPVERTFRFAEAGAAHDLSQEGHVRGKIVLVP